MSKDPTPYAKPLPGQPTIRNCRFAFRCHQNWNSLEPTREPRIRYCHECSRQVVLCQGTEELRAALNANACIALHIPRPHGPECTVGVIRL